MSNDALKREIKRLRDRLVQRDFRSSAPQLDADGLPMWDGSTPLTTEAFMKALGCSPDKELTEPELETRRRLAPFAEVFHRLDREKAAKEETVT